MNNLRDLRCCYLYLIHPSSSMWSGACHNADTTTLRMIRPPDSCDSIIKAAGWPCRQGAWTG